ncbi:methylated-DNA--[protein]-cysteine S-methyltransferase [Fluviicola sp.]|uniref:methylated-DNA--[protein]-cysteine S-methyltransferase n=1 Tax=Fluviicola sp. TaxID=1917219 RepID=UPI0031D78F3D
MDYYFKDMDSPVGRIRLVGSDKGIAGVLWENDNPKRINIQSYSEATDHPVLCEAENQLNEYFAGERKDFSLPLDFVGTEFQKQVWEALLSIPFGETRTYGQIARQINNPQSQQAVGNANNKNPIAIIAPCHRVIGASGELVGFAGGLKNKEILLKIEGRGGNQMSLWDEE